MNDALGYFLLGILALMVLQIVAFILITTAPMPKARSRASRFFYFNPAIIVPA